jgi:hypothetical protein
MGLDTKTYWLTERQSQCDFDFERHRKDNTEAEEFPLSEALLSNDQQMYSRLEYWECALVVRSPSIMFFIATINICIEV